MEWLPNSGRGFDMEWCTVKKAMVSMVTDNIVEMENYLFNCSSDNLRSSRWDAGMTANFSFYSRK